MSFAVGEAKEVPSLQMLRDHDKNTILIFIHVIFFAQMFPCYEERREEEEKEEGERSNMTKTFSKFSFFGLILRNSTHPLCGARSLLLVHIVFTPVKGPEGFKDCNFWLCL